MFESCLRNYKSPTLCRAFSLLRQRSHMLPVAVFFRYATKASIQSRRQFSISVNSMSLSIYLMFLYWF